MTAKLEKIEKIKKYRIDDVVEWTSGAGGSVTTKCGTVVGVIPANKETEKYLKPFPKDKYSHQLGSGTIRDHESYLVEVVEREGLKPRLYRPDVSRMVKVMDAVEEERKLALASLNDDRLEKGGVKGLIERVNMNGDCADLTQEDVDAQIESVNAPSTAPKARSPKKETKKRAPQNRFPSFQRKREFMKIGRNLRKFMRRGLHEMIAKVSAESKDRALLREEVAQLNHKFPRYQDSGKFRIELERIWQGRWS